MQDHHGERMPHRRRVSRTGKKLRTCAVLVDFEDIYLTLAREEGPTEDDSSGDVQALDDAVEVLSNLRERLRNRYNSIMAIGRSYADFDRVGGDAMAQLQLLAFEPRFMLNTGGRSSANVLLSIDAMEMLLTRPELDMFAIVGGGREYLPVVRRLREYMKRVVLVGFERATSGDLRQVVGEENYIAAEALLPDAPAALSRLVPQGNGRRMDSEGDEEEYDEGEVEARSAEYERLEREPSPSTEENLELCMHELLTAYYQFGERMVWLTPFLRLLNDRFPYLDNRGRKRLVEDLQARAAIRIEKVEGDPYPYSVVEINWENDWVQGLDEARGNV
jgi:hypothetical protein